jgi:hypothetical protein
VDSSSTNEELHGQIEALNLRVFSLEQSLDEMWQRFNNFVGSVGNQISASPPAASLNGSAHEAPVAEAEPRPKPRVITPGLAAVIRLIAVGQAEEAHKAMRELPQEELAEQPAVVTLAVAALCVQKGDYAAGLKALERARSMTDDSRLLRVIQAVEAQLA